MGGGGNGDCNLVVSHDTSPDLVCFLMTDYPQKEIPSPIHKFSKKYIFRDAWKELIKINHWNLSNKAVKKEVIGKILALIDGLPDIPKINMAEDCLFTFFLSIFARNAAYIPQFLYYYCKDNPHSTTRSRNMQHVIQATKDYQTIIDWIDSVPNINPRVKSNKKKLKCILYSEKYFYLTYSFNTINHFTPFIVSLKLLKHDLNMRTVAHLMVDLFYCIAKIPMNFFRSLKASNSKASRPS